MPVDEADLVEARLIGLRQRVSLDDLTTLDLVDDPRAAVRDLWDGVR